MTAPAPNPGSDDARAAGCICPVMDNCRGKFPPIPAGVFSDEGDWYIVVGCPVHSAVSA